MRFPKAETKIVSPLHEIIAGLEAHQDLFPNPPVSAADLDKQFETYLKSADTAVDKQAEAKHAVEEKNHALDAAVDRARMILRYAEQRKCEKTLPCSRNSRLGSNRFFDYRRRHGFEWCWRIQG
uniref:Uncharacterized protein n=1 Tax=Candidatus Kentrum sp. FW TaxID=2126338 RepID=A0A450TTX5_9GAMM|nr:MAG: hypothetical protein BECKFW1821C_GA0114237_103213 [Candidatus Kentron sp. FW]